MGHGLQFSPALDLATTDYFLLFQVTRFPPTREQYPKVDLLSVTNPTQSVSI